DFCKCSSHLSDGAKPYFSFSSLRGGFVNSHIPSSAQTQIDVKNAAPTARQTTRILMMVDTPKVQMRPRRAAILWAYFGSGLPARVGCPRPAHGKQNQRQDGKGNERDNLWTIRV